VSDRHLRRIFEAHFGVSPVQYLQTRRLLTAKQLLADTDLPITQVALVSGYASVRRFNDAFAEHYGLSPTELRREGRTASRANGSGPPIRLGWRPPYDADAMLEFFRIRRIAGVVRGRFLYSGGIGKLEDLEGLAALRQVNLGGVIVGKALYENRFTVREAHRALSA